MTDREILEDLYRAAVAAVDPGPATASALDSLLGTTGNSADPVWIIALGKAAVPMARAAIDVARARGLTIAGGVIVAPAPSVSPHPRVSVVVGDHPEPGAGSLAAADAIASLTRRLAPADRAWVLLSGGATSLVGAPLDGISADDLRQLYHLLLGSGLDISAMNLVRKRFTRWGGGKLAAALAPARVDRSHRLRCHRRRPAINWLRSLRPRPRDRQPGPGSPGVSRSLASPPCIPPRPGHRNRTRCATGNTKGRTSSVRLDHFPGCFE